MMDLDLLIRYERMNANFLFVNKEVAFYSLAGLTFNSKYNKRRKELKYVLKKNGANIVQIFMGVLNEDIKYIIKKIIPKEMRLRFSK